MSVACPRLRVGWLAALAWLAAPPVIAAQVQLSRLDGLVVDAAKSR